ncbi:MAG TPA: choice-of-anchor D domain-containing protein [Myxococcales bacterium]|nr:choice-of-anchor D domain-containing protein [Myxococcales bacterium]
MHRHVLLFVSALAAAALLGCPGGGPAPTVFELAAQTASDFGTVVVGDQGPELTFTVTNNQGSRSGTITFALEGADGAAYRLSNDACSFSELEPHASCTVGVIFAPLSAGTKTANLVARASTGRGQVALTGKGVTRALLQASPASVNFGTIPTGGNSTDATFTVTNAGGQVTGALAVALGGAGAAQFTKPADACNGATLAAGATCTIRVRFAPSSLGAAGAAVTVTGDPGGTLTIPVAGTGGSPATLVINPTSKDYGTVNAGTQTADTTFTVTNTGSVNATNLTVALSGSTADYVKTGDTCNGLAALVPTGGTGTTSCTVKVAFKPTAFGTKNLTVTVSGRVASSAATTQVQVSPTGVGQQSFPVNVTTSGNGAGRVTGGAIDCGATCTTNVTAAASAGTITLTAVVGANSSFTGWSGDCATQNPNLTCTLTVDAAKNAGAAFDLQRFSLAPVVSASPGAAGTITSSDSQINCSGSSCAPVSYNFGTVVTLTAAAGADSRFTGWSGDCSGSATTCQVTMSQARAVTANFLPNANYAFVTSTRYTLDDLGGGTLSAAAVAGGADAACNARAAAAGLPGAYVAWIASSGGTAGSRLGTARGWLRTDGLPFADQLPGNLFYPLRRDETGAAAAAAQDVLTNADSAGTAQGSCSDFTANTGTSAVAGNPAAGSALWSSWSTTEDCAGQFRLYCLGTGATATVSAPAAPSGARILFVSSGNFMTGLGGITGAHAMCQTEATTSVLPGTYKALMADDGATAASVFTPTGGAVVRPDGVRVAATDADLFASPAVLLAPPERTASGSLSAPTAVWTGADSPATAGTAGDTCTGWVSVTGAALVGVNSTAERMFAPTTDACSSAHPVFCLQE